MAYWSEIRAVPMSAFHNADPRLMADWATVEHATRVGTVSTPSFIKVLHPGCPLTGCDSKDHHHNGGGLHKCVFKGCDVTMPWPSWKEAHYGISARVPHPHTAAPPVRLPRPGPSLHEGAARSATRRAKR